MTVTQKNTGKQTIMRFSQAHALMIALPAGAYLWWRGIRYGRAPLYTSSVYRSFMIGIVSFVLLIIVWRISLGEGSLEELAGIIAPHVAAFFFFALVSLALINLQSIRQPQRRRDTMPQPTSESLSSSVLSQASTY